MKILNLSFIFCSLILSAEIVNADTNLKSYFGFSAVLEDGWFVVNPANTSNMTTSETLSSIGTLENIDRDLLSSIFENIKSGKVEFFYDKKHFTKEFQNNISVQLAPPAVFKSAEEMQRLVIEQCATLPIELEKNLNEKPIVHSCEPMEVNKVPFVHYSYTIPSKNIVIINDNVTINNEHSILFASGGDGNNIDGLHRLSKAQQSLLDGFTRFLISQQ